MTICARVQRDKKPARQSNNRSQKCESQPWHSDYFAFEKERLVGQERHRPDQDCQIAVSRNIEGEDDGEYISGEEITLMHGWQDVRHDKNGSQGKAEIELGRESHAAFGNRGNKDEREKHRRSGRTARSTSIVGTPASRNISEANEDQIGFELAPIVFEVLSVLKRGPATHSCVHDLDSRPLDAPQMFLEDLRVSLFLSHIRADR
jgi:hypothetical protein